MNRVRNQSSDWIAAIRGIYWSISSIGIHMFYYRHWRHKLQDGTYPPHYPRNTDPLALTRSTWRTSEWTKTVESMSIIWQLVGLTCGILLPLSIAFLQVDGVADNIWTRTLTLASSVFSSSGLLCSGLYFCDKSRFCNRNMSVKWVEASTTPKSARSIEFWALLALPFTSLVWSGICCICTILIVSWMKVSNTNDSGADGNNTSQINKACIACPIILTSIIFICIIQITRAMKIFSST